MALADFLAASLAAVSMPMGGAESVAPALEESRLNCPDQAIPLNALVASRSAHQPEGASQAGSPWIPLDAVLLPTSAQRRESMLARIRGELKSRNSGFETLELDKVLGVMRTIAREKFLPAREKSLAYVPQSLDIGYCQTLSDGYIIALMIAAAHVTPGANVLDVGTGSGYQAAILSRLGAHVQSLEIVPQLAAQARKRLRRMHYRNVEVVNADGYLGWPQRAPFDVILVAAGSTSIPQALLDQLKPGGRLILPVGPTALEEELVLVTKSEAGAVTRCTLGLAAFVPMTGQTQRISPLSTEALGPGRHAALPRCYAAAVT